MKLKFKRYHGCLNQFICLDVRNIKEPIQPYVPYWCLKKTWPTSDKNTGRFIGPADGVVAVQESTTADFKMLIINADGSIPEMCGNGLRCFAAFLIHENITTKRQLKIETLAGILDVTIIEPSFPKAIISVAMGVAKLSHQLPTNDFSNQLQKKISTTIGNFDIIPVSIGNPHAVIFVNDVDEINVPELGPLIQNLNTESGAPYFPNGVNVEFAAASKTIPNALEMRVFERGVGETMACGTGACATVVAGMHHNHCKASTSVILKGGTLDINVNSKNLAVTMTGPAECMLDEIEL